MADANIRINIETSSLEQLNAELSALQAQIAKVPVGSAEFKRLSAEIRRVDGAVEGANKKLKSLDVGAVAGDIAKLGGAVASASALFKQFGTEGSSSQEAVQAALETTNTILGAGAIAEGVASAARLAGVAATKAASAAQAAYSLVVGNSTGALKAFRIALASTGIGLAVVAIGALVANWDKLAAAIGGSTKSNKEFKEENDKLLEQLDKQAQKVSVNAERLRLLGSTEKEVLQFRIEENAKASAKLKAQQDEAIQRIVDARAEVRKENSANNRKELREAEENSDQLLIVQERYEKERAEFRREAVNIAISDYEVEAEKRSIAAKNNELALIQIEKDLQQKKLKEMQNAGIYTQKEIQKQQNAVNKAAQAEADYFVKVKEQQLEAERQYLNDRANLLDLSYEERLKTVDENQAAELKTIQKAGLSAAEIQAKTQSLNLKYSFERIKIVQDEETKKLELVRDSVTKRLELEAKAAETAGDVEKVKEIQEAIRQVNEETNKAIAAATKEAEDRLKELFKAGKLTEEAYKKAVADLTKVNTEIKTEINKTVTEGGAGIISTAIDNTISKFEEGLNKATTELGIAADQAEIEFLKAITGKKGSELDKAQEDFRNKQIENRRKIAEATIKSVDEEIAALEKLTNLSTQEEEDRSKKILELKAKRSKAEVEIAKTTAEKETDVTDQEVQKRLGKVAKYFEEVQKYYQALAASLQAIGNILADQAALQDLRFEEEIQKVQELYDERFRLIDEEEKKLDDLEQAKDNKISATERKRRALAKERAALEQQQTEELAQLEADKANAAADAAIKQAEVNFALAVGQIVISTAEAVAKSIATSPQTFGLPFSAFAVAQGALQLAAANSARQVAIAQAEASRPGVSGAKNVRVSKAAGGLITGPGNGVSDSVPANLSAGEFVVNANATSRFLPLLNQINQSGLQGGNPVNTAGFSNDEVVVLLSRIEDKLAQPTRSYIVTSDIENIQNKQNYINRRSNVL